MVLKIACCAVQPQRHERFVILRWNDRLCIRFPPSFLSALHSLFSDFHCHRLSLQIWAGSLSLLCFCICFVIIMFETLVASDSLISASSRSVLPSIGSLFHGDAGQESFNAEEVGVGNGVSKTLSTAQACHGLPATIEALGTYEES